MFTLVSHCSSVGPTPTNWPAVHATIYLCQETHTHATHARILARTHTKLHSRAVALFMKGRLKLQHIALLCAVCCRGISSTKIPTMIVMHHKHNNCNNLLISASRLRRSPLLFCNLSSWLYTPANYTEPKDLDLISVLLGILNLNFAAGLQTVHIQTK